MSKRSLASYFFSLILSLLVSSTQALSLKDVQLLRREYQQYQVWALSRNYLFGTTLDADPIKALAWQLIYIAMLPVSYPEKEKLLIPYKQNLQAFQITKATELASYLQNKYKLQNSFTEEELLRIHVLHEEHLSWSTIQGGGNNKTGVVGRVLPWTGIENSNIVLRLVNSEPNNDPWLQPHLPLTITNNGQFYITGLTAGRYQLFINTGGRSTFKQFVLRENEIKGLSLIDLRKK